MKGCWILPGLQLRVGNNHGVQRAVAAPPCLQHPAGSKGNAAKTPCVSSQLPTGETASGDQENCRAAFLQQHSLPSSESEDDDGFLELLDDQDLKVCAEGRGWGSQNQLCPMCLVCSGCPNCTMLGFWESQNPRLLWFGWDLKALPWAGASPTKRLISSHHLF